MQIPPVRFAPVGMIPGGPTSGVGLPEYCLLLLHRGRPSRKDAVVAWATRGASDTGLYLAEQYGNKTDTTA
jgi:hypothetical protein